MSLAAKVAGAADDALRTARLIPRVWIGALCAGISIALLPLFFPLDGKPHADWLQFVGRFHPLLVHLPIGLIVLLPLLGCGDEASILEGCSRLCVAVRPGNLRRFHFLWISLAYGSGEIGTTVTRHMRGGIVLAIELLLCLGPALTL